MCRSWPTKPSLRRQLRKFWPDPASTSPRSSRYLPWSSRNFRKIRKIINSPRPLKFLMSPRGSTSQASRCETLYESSRLPPAWEVQAVRTRILSSYLRTSSKNLNSTFSQCVMGMDSTGAEFRISSEFASPSSLAKSTFPQIRIASSLMPSI